MVNCLKKEIRENKEEINQIKREINQLKFKEGEDSEKETEELDQSIEFLINQIARIHFKKWYSMVTLKIKDFKITLKAFIDSGADQNCIQQRFNSNKILRKDH